VNILIVNYFNHIRAQEMSLFNLQDMRYTAGRGGICYLKQEIEMVIYHHFQSNQI